MSVSFAAGGTFVQSQNTRWLNATTPAGIQTGDRLLFGIQHTTALTPPSGWTKLEETTYARGDSVAQTLAVFAKDSVSSSDSSSQFTWEQASFGIIGGCYAVVRGADAPTVSAKNTDAVTTWTIQPNSIPVAANGSLFVVFGAFVSGSAATINISPFDGTSTPSVPNSFTRFSGDGLLHYRVCGAYRGVNGGDSIAGSFNFVPGGADPPNYISTEEGLGAITVLFAPEAPATVEGQIQVAGPLGATALTGLVVHVVGTCAMQSLMQSAATVAAHDFYDVLSDDPRHFYTMQLQTPDGAVRVPISSWQATLHVEDASFVQAVVPAADQWVDELGDADLFVVFRRTTLLDGREIEAALASAPLQTLTFAQGGFAQTATLQGYLTDLALDQDAVATPTLRNVQTVFIYADGIRVRCAIDWQLRPGMTCYYGTTPIVVEYINYYVTQGQSYMDVGGS